MLLSSCGRSAIPGSTDASIGDDGGGDAEGDDWGDDGGTNTEGDDGLGDDDSDVACEEDDDCPNEYRCKDSLCIIGWTVTSFPGQGKPVKVSGQGDIYLSGKFEGEIDFDPSSAVDLHSANGGTAGFVTRLDKRGGYVKTVTFSGLVESDRIFTFNALEVGSNGVYYVGGIVKSGTIDVDPGPDTYEVTAPETPPNHYFTWPVFIVRLEDDDVVSWVHTFHGTVDPYLEYVVKLTDISVEDDGSVIAAGSYNSLNWKDESSNDVSLSSTGIATFARSIDGAGNHKWTLGQKCSSHLGRSGPLRIINDVNGRIFTIITGPQTVVDFDPGPDADWKDLDKSNIIWRLSSSGEYLGTIEGIGKVQEIDQHQSGDLLVAGFKYKEDDNDIMDSFVSRLDGEYMPSWEWNPEFSDNDLVTALSTDEQGRIYVAVGWYGIVNETILVALTDNGDELWRREFPGVVNFMHASSEYGLFLSGRFSIEGDFDPGPGEDIRSPLNSIDTFLTRLTLDGTY